MGFLTLNVRKILEAIEQAKHAAESLPQAASFSNVEIENYVAGLPVTSDLKPNHLYQLRFNPVPSFIKNFGIQQAEVGEYTVQFWGRRSLLDSQDFYVYMRYFLTQRQAGDPPVLEAGGAKVVGYIVGAGVLGAIGIIFLKEIKDITFPTFLVLAGGGYFAGKLFKVW